MHSQLIQEIVKMKSSDRRKILLKLGVSFQQGNSESVSDYVKRVLTAIDNDGNIRLLEQLITETK